MPEILGENYPYYFKTKEQFFNLLNLVEGNKINVSLLDHDAVFKKNLIDAMESNIHVMKQEPKATREWLFLLLKNAFGEKTGYKQNLLKQTHPDLFASNSWERVRCWCMEQGVLDDPNSQFTRLWIPDEARTNIEKLIDGMDFSELEKNLLQAKSVVEEDVRKKSNQFFGE
jgi:hypothetical protein